MMKLTLDDIRTYNYTKINSITSPKQKHQKSKSTLTSPKEHANVDEKLMQLCQVN